MPRGKALPRAEAGLRLAGRGPATVPDGAGAEVRRPKRRGALVVLTALLVASAVVFGLVLVNIALAQSSFELGDLQKRVGEEQLRGRRLRYEVARAESPERVAAMAAQLGLVSPEREEHLQGPALLVSSESEPRGGLAGYELSTAAP